MTNGNGYPSTSTNSFVSFNNYVPRQTTSSSSAGSFAGSPTFKIDSEDATGATHRYMVNKSSARLPRQRRPFAGAYQPQATYTARRQNVMYFEPGTEVDSPTLNIRSARATGTIEQVVTRHSVSWT
ncbi:hypothetical protein DEU56DRAFT_756500 [Suillus clintonianus]|uniref:uncharacterized protein n=1 Tax=Suillus clintonianus TaxID=1904413 RepID=UPI001B862E6A|nr:uncharacterized protein DEU56DRAFT_756500 [Suillus clintonianus]KAG2135808.1 hypothetical protein DEU56DRAFT_756500 [Suillus clintonianus]